MINLKNDLSNYSPKQKAFIFFAMLCSFFICAEYALIRPIANSLFIESFSASFFPYAWLATLPLNFLAVFLYSRLIEKWGSKKLFFALIALVASINFSLSYGCRAFPFLSFGLYVWKEIYILWMFQLLWSVIHANISLSKAKYLYGLIFGIGGLGSLFGSSIPGFFALQYGSESLIILSLPLYICLFICYIQFIKRAEETGFASSKTLPGFKQGLTLIFHSRFLIFILLIVIFMQMSSSLVDFQFNHFLEKFFSEKDLRTEQSARLYGIVHFLTVAFQFFGTYLLIQWMGMKKVHFFVPLALGILGLSFAFFPVLPVLSLYFVTIKSFDFSVFGVIKEMLYIPLSPEEKFRAKAVIDVFAYRSSKAFVSLLILCLQFFFLEISSILTLLTLIITFLWIVSVAYYLRSEEKILTPKGKST